jgi:hypothetical protein
LDPEFLSWKGTAMLFTSLPDNLDFSKLLSFGAIGFGCILALLAFSLLWAEQRKDQPRTQLLAAIYVFMVFALLLTGAGFIAEHLSLKTRIDDALLDLSDNMEAKGENIHELKNLNPADPNLTGRIVEIVNKLNNDDRRIENAVKRLKGENVVHEQPPNPLAPVLST